MSTLNLEEQIEQYVRGKLQGSDLASFQQQMQADPSIQMEVRLQSGIRKAVIENRKAMLKTRLNNIDVSALQVASSTGTNATFTALKVASIALVGAGLSVATYMYVRNSNSTSNQEVSTIAQTASPAEITTEQATEMVNDASKTSIETAPATVNATSTVQETPARVTTAPASVKAPTSKATKKVPNLDALDDKSAANVTLDGTDETPNVTSSSEQIQKLSDVDVKTIQDGSHKFHYRMKDHVLYLYGEFNKSPYEILEFNGPTSNVLYFYYDNNYYPMESEQKSITKLRKISDKKLISDLDQARVR